MPILSIDVEARTARFSDSLRKVETDAKSMVKNIDAQMSALKGTFAALGGAALLGGLANGIKTTADYLDGLGEAAQRAGTTAEQLSALQYAAKFAGVENEQLEKGLQTLSKRLVEAQQGGKEATEAFQRLKIDPSQFTSAADVLPVLADRLAGIESPAEQVKVAFDLLGKSGVAMIPMLTEGSAGLAKMREEAKRLGLVISNDAVDAASRLNDNLDRLGLAASALQVYLAGPLINTLADLSDGFMRSTAAGNSFSQTLKNLWSANSLQTTASQGIAIQEQIWAIQKALDGGAAGAQRSQLEQKLAALKAQLPAITAEVERLKGVVTETFGNKADRQKPQQFTLAEPPAKPDKQTKPAKVLKDQISDGERLIQQIMRQWEAENKLNEVQKVGIELARLGKSVKQGEAEAAINLAQQVDAAKALNEEKKAAIELDKLIEEAEARGQEQMAADAEKYRDLADPFRKVAREIEHIQDLLKAGLITPEVAEKSIKAAKDVGESVHGIGNQVEYSRGLSDDFWASFESGAERGIFEGGKFSDILKQLAIDFAKLAFRQSIMQSLGMAFGIGTPQPGQVGSIGGGADTSIDPMTGMGALSDITTSATKSVTVNNSISVTGSGVTRADVAAAMAATRSSTLSAVSEAQRRGVLA